jgi:hypothetical protein
LTEFFLFFDEVIFVVSRIRIIVSVSVKFLFGQVLPGLDVEVEQGFAEIARDALELHI